MKKRRKKRNPGGGSGLVTFGLVAGAVIAILYVGKKLDR